MRPEEKFARRFLRDAGLQPPISIREVVEDIADIEEDAIPCNVDAVLVRSAGARPHIILQVDNPPTRKTFTLAHELGHLTIPWHVGTIVCHVDYDVHAPRYIYDEIESEANRFASEVLMPHAWIQAQIEAGASLESIVNEIKRAGVSPLAASFALIRASGPGYVFVESNLFAVPTYAAKSEGTLVHLPERGEKFDPRPLDSIAEDRYVISLGSTILRCWKLAEQITPPDVNAELRTSQELLQVILADVTNDSGQRLKLLQSINGIVGAANSSRLSGGQDLHTALRTRFLNRPQLGDVVSHRLFSMFLAKKASEIGERTRSTSA